ncbi:MAG: phytoene/squalene synthase family protein [Gemmatimonadota bacterium]|nr:phytoene/squalene synthase family protein [Gemmatimonadota bacterium]
MSGAARVGEQIIRHHSKSFSLASRLLPRETQSHAVALYAWCRRADDAIDLAPPGRQGEALASLQAEVDQVYSSTLVQDPVLAIFQRTIRARRVPKRYAQDLLTGMRMDVEGRRYETMDQLLEYCYCVAGCVGLMMCHVMGLKREAAVRNAAHLGIAMQLTNICRDIQEDWDMERLYVPDELLTQSGAPNLAERLGEPFPEEARTAVASATDRLLIEADSYYASGDQGFDALPWRCSLAIRTARVVYSSIGTRIREQGCDPLAGRAYVSGGGKLMLMLGSVASSLARFPAHLTQHGDPAVPVRVVSFPDDVLPIEPSPSPGSRSRK